MSLHKSILDAIATEVATLADTNIPSGQVRVRETAILVPERDGTAGWGLVCPTPNAQVSSSVLLGNRREVTYPVTVIVATPANRNPAVSDWRFGWADSLLNRLHRSRSLAGVAQAVRVRPAQGVFLDMTQFDAAGLWWSVVNLSVVCRVLRT